ncbi:MAG: hypothetical protein LBD12_01780 [Clostridiales Family XIII bacterium]|jgi:hypothetical protein|nr:hypothetical protein [Clostridiales Family XIII bacterium]
MQVDSLPEVRALPIMLGGTPRVEDIVGRDRYVEKLWAELEYHSIIIKEARRFGKTTATRLLEARAPKGWVCVRGTVQDAKTTADLVGLTLCRLHQHAEIDRKLKKAIESVGRVTKSMSAGAFGANLSFEFHNGQETMIHLRRILASVGSYLGKKEKQLLIVWDEFPDAIRTITKTEGKDAAAHMMAFFRALREMEGGEYIRWALTGSVGFHHVLKVLPGRSSLINDMLSVDLPPLTNEWACWMAKCLLIGIGRKTDGAELLAVASGGIPFVLELLVKHLKDMNQATPETADAATKLLNEVAVSDSLGSNWAALLERVEGYYGEDRDLAEDILDLYAESALPNAEMYDALAKKRKNKRADVPEDTHISDVLRLLIDDHYLRFDLNTRCSSWRYEPLRAIWRARRAVTKKRL